jgi:hypothetical protein
MPLTPKFAAAVTAAVLAYLDAQPADGPRREGWKTAGRSWPAGREWKLSGRLSLMEAARLWSKRPAR